MKKKIFIFSMIFTLLYSSYAFGYSRVSNGNDISQIADLITDDTVMSSAYTAVSGEESSDDVVISGSLTKSDTAVDYKLDSKKYYITSNTDGNLSEYTNTFLTIKLDKSTTYYRFSDDDFYILYKNAVTYEGNKYNVKLKLNSIKKDDEEQEFSFIIGSKNVNDNTTRIFNPGVSVCNATSRSF